MGLLALDVRALGAIDKGVEQSSYALPPKGRSSRMRERIRGGEVELRSLGEIAAFNHRNIIGTTPMEIEQQKPPDMSARQQANELIKLICKLRWMRMEEEAVRVETALGSISPADRVLATPVDTD